MARAKTAQKWEIGDLVEIIPKNGHSNNNHDPSMPITITKPSNTTNVTIGATPTHKRQTGQVVAIRGGWYSVLLSSNGDNARNDLTGIVKCRGTQLRRLSTGINDGKVESRFDAHSGTNINGGKTVTTNASSSLTQAESSTMPVEAFRDEQWSYEAAAPPAICDLDTAISGLQDSPHAPTTDDELLQQAAHHASYEHWVAFSDLHCSPSTLDTCLEVLERVHETALSHPSQKCGVLFLGDFWHHRGTLRVDCLNAVLDAFKAWTVPLVMIPGNHDQVTLGGDNHGLTPLSNAFRVGGVAGPMILSTPTVFRRALFVPHVKNAASFKAIVGSPEARASAAIFLHAEIKGAMMNDLVISTHGIAPSVFPSHKRIYSGHFHKPHTIHASSKSKSSIEYLGSPYQISLAEAHQQKQLVVLDANWECQTRVPLSVGRQHFKLSSVEQIESIKVADKETASAPPALHSDSICVKRGDRIVVSLPHSHHRRIRRQNPPETDPWMASVQSLREQGLMVELREAPGSTRDATDQPQSGTDAGNPNFEDLLPESVWRAYLKECQVRDSMSEEDCKSLLDAGLEILQDIQQETSSFSFDEIQNGAVQRDLRLTSLSVAGFGPFQDTIDYPLDDRGLVLLRGSNSDCGPDSNGTGKSSLAMATLWGLTGSLDSRPATDRKVADVVNDQSKVATVTVRGFVNDAPFVLTRSKTASRGDLLFKVNDVDLTTQSVKETQAVIEERLGVDSHILSRVAFYGQHGMNDLLEATDSKLKEELSLVVPLELWQHATSVARARSRKARQRADESEGMIRLRAADINALSNKVSRARETRDNRQKGLIAAEERLNRELARIQDHLDRATDTNVDEVQMNLEDVSTKIEMLNDLYDATLREKELQLTPLEEELMHARDVLASVTRNHTAVEMDTRSSKISLESAKARLNRIHEKWSLDVSEGNPSAMKPPERCPTCKQPLHSDSSGEIIQNAKMAMEKDIQDAQATLTSAEKTYKEASMKATECTESLHLQEALLRDLQLNHKNTSSAWNTKFQDLQEQLRNNRHAQNSLTSQLSMVVKESQLHAERDAAKASFNAETLNVAHADEVYNGLEKELEIAVEFLKELRSEKETEENRQSVLSSVGERFGQRGVQTFLLQNTVESLQRTAQLYLSYLSEDSQRLELTLDAGDKIVRSAFVRGADGDFKQRPLSTLSGGQWRRSSLALSFAFAELVAGRGRLRSSLLVLDEPLTHLDRSGRAKFGELVRTLLGSRKGGLSMHVPALKISTAIVILQDLSAEELEEAFDGIDTVVRKDGKSCLKLDEMTSDPV